MNNHARPSAGWTRRHFCRSMLGGVTATTSTACAHTYVLTATTRATENEIPGYVERSFVFKEQSHRIFHGRSSGPAVIILHELPGLTIATTEFADWIASQGFHVVMPLLFGEPLQDRTLGGFLGPFVCIRREFNCLTHGVASPATEWLRALCRAVHSERGGIGVGVVGMCLSGGFALTLMADESVMASVAAEPALPYLQREGLDVDPDVLRQAAQRANNAPLLGLRFAEDTLCPSQRFEAIRKAFCGSDGTCKRFIEVVIPGKGHSTLTYDYQGALAAGIDTRKRVVDYLRAQLEKGP